MNEVPFYFHFMKVKDITKVKKQTKLSFIEIEFYQTDKVITYAFYKPISKIISIKYENNK